jgi:hypothetical protein
MESNKITQEVNKFLANDFIKKVMYPSWLANRVIVK